MIKKSIVALVVIVAAAAMVFGASNYTNSTIGSSDQEQDGLPADKNTFSKASDNSDETKISAEEAKKIAQKYIEEPGTNAGKPKLIKTDGRYIYVVPVMDNGTNVGEINIDALTGKNVGGAGGAP